MNQLVATLLVHQGDMKCISIRMRHHALCGSQSGRPIRTTGHESLVLGSGYFGPASLTVNVSLDPTRILKMQRLSSPDLQMYGLALGLMRRLWRILHMHNWPATQTAPAMELRSSWKGV